MELKLRELSRRFSLAQQFMLAGLVILIGGMIGLGQWMERQIEQSVVHRTAETTALFVDSFIAPNLQELAETDTISPEHIAVLSRLLDDTLLGQHVVAFKVWDSQGKVLYSAEPATIGEVFDMTEGLQRAWQGEVSSRISPLEEEENELERIGQSELLETYSPVRDSETGRIIAVAEFYQSVEDLERDIAVARQRSWLIVGLAGLIMYVLLSGFVGRASDTIEQQQAALSLQVSQLTDLLAQNQVLHDRVRRAAARTTSLNEQFLRRIGAELHDGPLQDLSLALLQLDHVVSYADGGVLVYSNGPAVEKNLSAIQGSLQRAMQEIRSLSAGLGVPHLNRLTLPETIMRAKKVHEQRSHTRVMLHLENLPDEASLPVKITVFRLIQEALNNAFRHAGGKGQKVKAGYNGERLVVEVSDQGPGFRLDESFDWDRHLGLAGMRERVESLGGLFYVESAPGTGTRVIAFLPLEEMEARDDWRDTGSLN